MIGALRVLAWEVTRRCPMRCAHCRGASRDTDYDGELSAGEGLRVLDSIAARNVRPLIIFTGGEALCRDDLELLVRRAAGHGFPCALATCGHGLTEERLRALGEAGVRMLSVSLDGPDAGSHDAFRGVPGAWDRAMRTIGLAKRVSLPFQINTTVHKGTAPHLRRMRDLAGTLGAARLDLFFLVPVGRGRALTERCLTASETETCFTEIQALDAEGCLPLHLTCAPQFMRRLPAPTGRPKPGQSSFNGCLAGVRFAFLSHVGDLQPCGFLDIPCGNVRDFGCDLPAAYEASETFRRLTEPLTEGCCGDCPAMARCRGCRARAYAADGNLFGPDPSCLRF